MTNSKAPWLTRGGAIALMAAAAIALAACSGGGGLNEDEAAGLQQELKEARAQATLDAAARMTAVAEAALAQTAKETAEAEAKVARTDQEAAETALRLAKETAAEQVSDAEADVETARKEAEDALDAKAKADAALIEARAKQKEAEVERDAAVRAEATARQQLQAEQQVATTEKQRRIDAEAEQDQLEEDNEELRQEVNRVDARVALAGLVSSVDTAVGTVDPLTVKARYRGMTTVTATPAGDTALTLRPSSAPSIGSPWSGTTLSSTTSEDEDELVVYTNIGPATRVSIEVKHPTFMDTDDTDNKAIFTKDITTAADGQYIRGSGWPTSEGDSKTYETATYDDPTHADDLDDMSNDLNTVKVSGSYDGASGDFYCSGPPSCEVTRKGNIFVVPNNQWKFVTDASRTVSQDDESFMHFGWWRRMDVESGSLSFASFSGGTNGVSSGGARSFTQVFGPVTYNGSAVGQYAIYQPLGGQSGAGSFTARARLTADFGASDEVGTLSGEVTNFSNDSTWLVRLNSQILTDVGALNDGATGWEIDGDHSTEAGAWSAQFYTEEPFDGQTPDGVAGTFHAQFDSVGRIMGAFGARK